jgi:hypothetical protein
VQGFCCPLEAFADTMASYDPCIAPIHSAISCAGRDPTI